MKQDGVSKEDIVTMLENPESLLVKPVEVTIEEPTPSGSSEAPKSCCIIS
jgi:hypothetical protein